jgi:hypothetical protein
LEWLLWLFLKKCLPHQGNIEGAVIPAHHMTVMTHIRRTAEAEVDPEADLEQGVGPGAEVVQGADTRVDNVAEYVIISNCL